MSVTAIGDHSSKSHREPHKSKSKSTASCADPEDADKARAKSKRRKHRKPTSDALSTNLLTDQAHTIKDSSTCDFSYPLNSSPISSGNVTSNNAQLANSATGNSVGSPKGEKDKKDLQGVVRDASEGQESRKEKNEKKKNKKRSRDRDKSEDGSNNDASGKEKKKKKNLDKKEGVTQSDNTEVLTTEEVASDKTRQKKRKRVTEEQLERSEVTPSSNKPRKKKKSQDSTDTLSPDPSADEVLSDQSRKALSYAYARFQDPPNWKFNKARQIWLIRKLWSEEMIPEKYFALVTKYLASVEGRIRDTLVQMCNSEIALVTTNTSVDLATGSTEPSDKGPAATTKVMRARSLLDALSHVKN